MASEGAMKAPSTTHVLLGMRTAGVAVVELNRPLKRNALSQDLIDELTGVLRHLDRDRSVMAVVLTSVEGSPFCGTSHSLHLKSPTRMIVNQIALTCEMV